MQITIPYKYEPRAYQLPILKAYEQGYKRILWLAHRRAGKDKTAINFIIQRMLERVGGYFYVFPEFNQGRRIIWDGIDKSGFKFLDHFPKELIKGKPNTTEMKIELKNGSVFQIVGSNEVDRLVGTNPVGIVYSEYAIQDPNAWNYLRPILAENGGWALFIFTPRGKNHGWELYRQALESSEWAVFRHDAEYTQAIPKDILEQERKEMLSQTGDDALYNQEYMLSFEAPQSGSYYAKIIQEALEQNRITTVEYDSNVKVKTWWDLGVGDYTAIWFTQQVGGEIRFIDYYEAMGEGIQHYVDVLNSKGYAYEAHFAPHDIEVRELGTGKSRREIAASKGLQMGLVPNLPLDDGIAAVRSLFHRFVFDATKCKRGLECIMDYHKEYDDKHKTYRSYPAHTWSSHGADALRYAAIGMYEQYKGEGEKLYEDYEEDEQSSEVSII